MLGIRALCVYGVRLGYTFALFWRNHSLNRTLRLRLEDTFARKTKLKQALFWFSLAYSYYEVAPPRYSRSDLSK